MTALAWIPFTVGMALTFCARRRDVGWLLLGVYVAWGVQLLVVRSAGDAAGTFVAADGPVAAGDPARARARSAHPTW